MSRIAVRLFLISPRPATASAAERNFLLCEDGAVLVDESGRPLSLE